MILEHLAMPESKEGLKKQADGTHQRDTRANMKEIPKAEAEGGKTHKTYICICMYNPKDKINRSLS